MALFTTNHAITVRMLRKPSFSRMLYSRPVISLSSGTKMATGMEVRATFDSQVTVDSTPSPSPWTNVTGCTTVPWMSSRLLRTLPVLAYPLSSASRPHPSRSLPTKSMESGTTQSIAIASRNQRLGCSNSAPPAKTNWTSYLATSLAFPPVSNSIRSSVTTWILVSCTPPHLISLVPARKPTVLLPCMMDSLRTS